jgi:MFS family permease
VSTVTCTSDVDDAALARLLVPRTDLVTEQAAGPATFELSRGPYTRWIREVSVEPLSPGRHRVTERVDFHLAVPLWGVLFVWPIRRRIRRVHRELAAPDFDPEGRDAEAPPQAAFWEPPQRLDARAAGVLATICTISVVVGYLGTLITQSITFASSQFGSSTAEQSGALAAVRVGVLLALVLVALADRRGRRQLLLFSVIAGCLTAAAGALSPDLWVLGITQTVSRGFSTAALLLLAVVAAEEMPAGCRAYAVSVMTLTSALGAGMCVWFLPLADTGSNGWRILYVIPLAGIPLVAWTARHLPETLRFQRPHARVPLSGHGRRLWLLGAGLFCAGVFAAPASQLQNQFLRVERGFDASHITIFTLATSTPAGLGVILGGRLADTHGRRIVAAIGTVGGTVCVVISFFVRGWPLWVWSLAGTMFAAAAVPALGVYGPELFPTGLRGKANGVLQTAAVAGSSVGLLVAGAMADHFGRIGPGLALLAIGPLILVVLVVRYYPETAQRELEQLNPEDRSDATLAPPLPSLGT